MSLNLIAINVGNTRVQIGSYADGKLLDQQRFVRTDLTAMGDALAKMHDQIRDEPGATVYLSTVDESMADQVEAIVGQRLGCLVVRIERDVPVPVGRQLDPEAIVGEDRLLNAAAAYDQVKGACIVIDAGTAVTVDFIDGEGTFHGGAILPGMKLQSRVLNEYTALLPIVEPAAPDEPIGHNTVQAIRTGIFHGIRGAVRELVEKYAEVYQGYPRILATGGDAELLFEGYDLVEAIVPDLTLRGMLIAHRYALEASE